MESHLVPRPSGLAVTADRRASFDAAYFESPAVIKSGRAAEAYAELLGQSLDAGSLVLDVGCASGAVGTAFHRMTGAQVIGLDVSVVPLRLVGDAVSAACASSDGLPLRSGSADGAFFLDVVEHLESPLAALVELRRVVRRGGSLVISTPNAGSPLRPLLGRRWHGFQDDTHLYFFNAFSLGHLLEKAGWHAQRSLTRSGAPGLGGRVLARARLGGELCILATAS